MEPLVDDDLVGQQLHDVTPRSIKQPSSAGSPNPQALDMGSHYFDQVSNYPTRQPRVLEQNRMRVRATNVPYLCHNNHQKSRAVTHA